MDNNFKAPIGIFDSGIGGLTIASAIKQAFPEERLLYFGDTAHLPYGDKSEAAVLSYLNNISAFFAAQKCKLMVIACNSASTVAIKHPSKFFPQERTINVIHPTLNKIAQTQPEKIGVIGTKRTIQSKVYQSGIAKLLPNAKVKALATPLLAPMIEEGFFNNKISLAIIQSYLQEFASFAPDTLILGCTHYPLIVNEVQQIVGKQTLLVDALAPVVAEVGRKLLNQELTPNAAPHGDAFYVSDLTDSFKNTAAMFFGEAIQLQLKQL